MTNPGSGPLSPMESAIAAIRSPWMVPFDGGLQEPPRNFSAPPGEKHCKDKLHRARKAIRPLQERLYAGKQASVLLVFQALDAAGKDGAIREVFEDLDPVNLRVSGFKQPNPRELRHDFLWRTVRRLPQRGEIAIFNRSYYEEVLVVRVHPGFLDAQYADAPPKPAALGPERYRAIREHERHLATAGTLILKFWLNVSPSRQAKRFLERLDTPEKRWKFSLGDVRESNQRAAYDEALMHMLNETSRAWAPWFCIPADDRWYLRWQIADIIRQGMHALGLEFPPEEDVPATAIEEARTLLQNRLESPDET